MHLGRIHNGKNYRHSLTLIHRESTHHRTRLFESKSSIGRSKYFSFNGKHLSSNGPSVNSSEENEKTPSKYFSCFSTLSFTFLCMLLLDSRKEPILLFQPYPSKPYHKNTLIGLDKIKELYLLEDRCVLWLKSVLIVTK